MSKRCALTNRRWGRIDAISPTNLIERLRKLKALDGNPSQLGIHQYTIRRSTFNKISFFRNKSDKNLW